MLNLNFDLLRTDPGEPHQPRTSAERLSVGILTVFLLTILITVVFALLPILNPGYFDLLCPYAVGCGR